MDKSGKEQSRGKHGDRWTSVKARSRQQQSGAAGPKQTATLHLSASLSGETKTAIFNYWPPSHSCMHCAFLAEKIFQQMSLYG